MRKYYVSAGLLVVFLTPVLCCAQEAAQSETAPPQEVEQLPPPAPDQAECDYVFELSSEGNVCFPHRNHRKLGCKTCHHQSRAKPLETPHPDYLTSSWHSCKTCHDPEIASQKTFRNCLSCHLPDPVSIADETPTAKVALHKNCWKCHDSGTGAEASKKCPECHIEEEE